MGRGGARRDDAAVPYAAAGMYEGLEDLWDLTSGDDPRRPRGKEGSWCVARRPPPCMAADDPYIPWWQTDEFLKGSPEPSNFGDADTADLYGQLRSVPSPMLRDIALHEWPDPADLYTKQFPLASKAAAECDALFEQMQPRARSVRTRPRSAPHSGLHKARAPPKTAQATPSASSTVVKGFSKGANGSIYPTEDYPGPGAYLPMGQLGVGARASRIPQDHVATTGVPKRPPCHLEAHAIQHRNDPGPADYYAWSDVSSDYRRHGSAVVPNSARLEPAATRGSNSIPLISKEHNKVEYFGLFSPPILNHQEDLTYRVRGNQQTFSRAQRFNL